MSTKVIPTPTFGHEMVINESTTLVDQEHLNALIDKIDIS